MIKQELFGNLNNLDFIQEETDEYGNEIFERFKVAQILDNFRKTTSLSPITDGSESGFLAAVFQCLIEDKAFGEFFISQKYLSLHQPQQPICEAVSNLFADLFIKKSELMDASTGGSIESVRLVLSDLLDKHETTKALRALFQKLIQETLTSSESNQLSDLLKIRFHI